VAIVKLTPTIGVTSLGLNYDITSYSIHYPWPSRMVLYSPNRNPFFMRKIVSAPLALRVWRDVFSWVWSRETRMFVGVPSAPDPRRVLLPGTETAHASTSHALPLGPEAIYSQRLLRCGSCYRCTAKTEVCIPYLGYAPCKL